MIIVFLIKRIRVEKGMTTSELAEKACISRSYLSELENNKKYDTMVSTLQKIADALKVDIKKTFVAVSDVESLRKRLNASIEKYGLGHEKTLALGEVMNVVLNRVEK